MSIESEEFYNLMQAYRHTPAVPTIPVVEAYQAVIDHVDVERFELIQTLNSVRELLIGIDGMSANNIRQIAAEELEKVNAALTKAGVL